MVLASIAIEALRFYLYSEDYEWRLVVMILASLSANIALTVWTLADTYPKVILTALYNQTTLPYTVFYIWALINQMVPRPPKFPRPL